MSLEPRPDISVCIANYNGGDFVMDCLASVHAQRGDFRVEVLIHDDASSDDSLARIEAAYPQDRIIRSTTNSGFCISNNRMAAQARGRYLLLLNNDAKLRPGTLQRLYAFAESGEQDSILGLPQCAMADGTVVDHGYRTDPFLNPIPIMAPGTHTAGVATGACLWIPRQVWDAVGGFPPWFESVAEDIFLCLAARLLGYRVIVLDGPGFDHCIGMNLGGGKVVGGGLRTTTRRRALSERNKVFCMLCCYPMSALAVLLPLHAAFLFFEAIFLLATAASMQQVSRIYAGIPRAIWHRRSELRALRSRLMARKPVRDTLLFAFTDWIPHKLVMLRRHGKPIIK
jgi:GT2 family glycosyltransferase